jgi:hypothetical protein
MGSPEVSAGSAAVLTAGGAVGDARRIGVLFMIGSACFAIASLPAASDLSHDVVGITYFVGSICFLVSSVLAEIAVWGPLVPARRSATLNLIGSVAFGISALAAYVVPDTDQLVNASLATSGTLVGALCFYWAARVLVKPPPWLRSRPVT